MSNRTGMVGTNPNRLVLSEHRLVPIKNRSYPHLAMQPPDTWYSAYDCAEMRTTAATFTTSGMYCMPLFVGRSLRNIDRIRFGIEIVTNSPGVTPQCTPFGIYTDKGGQPHKLIVGASGSLNTDGLTGFVYHDVLESGFYPPVGSTFGRKVNLPEGLYWMCAHVLTGATATVRTIDRVYARRFNLGIPDASPPSDSTVCWRDDSVTNHLDPPPLEIVQTSLVPLTIHPPRLLVNFREA